MKDSRLGALADVLMAAAHADQHLDRREKVSVIELLEKLLGATGVPESVTKRIELFDLGDFEMAAAVEELGTMTPESRRRVLELVAAVHEADEIIDLDEHQYLVDLAKAMGASESEYEDLTLQILSIEELRESFEGISKPPPPK